jgi:TRAP-type C4-dicarboxylate transport system permease small subunit
MMAITHGLAAVALATLLLPLGPTYAVPPVLAAAFLGGVAPDLDAVAAHRKTLHYPVGFAAAAVATVGLHVVAPNAALWLVCVAVAAAAVHALSDILAGSVEREPWNPTTERAVYNHLLGVWHRPRRYVRYSGAVEDFALAFGCGLVAVAAPVTGPTADRGLVALIAVGALYTVVRHPSVSTRAVVDRLPRRLRALCPAVHVEETDGGATTVSIGRR